MPYKSPSSGSWSLVSALSFVLFGFNCQGTPPKKHESIEKPLKVCVLKGQTLEKIAKKHQVSVKALINSNHLKPPFRLLVGQNLSIPILEKKSPPSSRPIHLVPKKVKESSLKFMRPVVGPIVAEYGFLKNGTLNDGINIAAPLGRKVCAAENGTVLYQGSEIESYGNLILVKHSNDWISAYAHLKEMKVKKGKVVKKGQVIGTVGKTGHVKTPQVHFELRKGNKPLNPILYSK